MKKKVLLCVAMLLVVITASLLLVGCTSSNPINFLEKFEKADNKIYYRAIGKEGDYDYYAINGNIIMEMVLFVPDEEEGQSFQAVAYEWFDDYVIRYLGIKTAGDERWEAHKFTKEEFMDGKYATIQDLYKVEIDNILDEIKDEPFDKNNYEKKNGWFVGKQGVKGVENKAFKIKGNELLFQCEYSENPEYYGKFVIGGDKIVLPEKAIEAAKGLK